MINRLASCFLTIATGLAFLETTAGDELKATITVQCRHEVSVAPDFVRLTFHAFGKGDDFQAATNDLDERKSQIGSFLGKHGINADAISFGEFFDASAILVPKSSNPILEPTVAANEVSQGAFDESAPTLSKSVMGCLVAVRVPLGTSRSFSSIEPYKRLKQEVISADLTGVRALDALGICKSCSGQIELPELNYVAALSEEELEQAERACFAKAKGTALRTARACERSLCELTSIQSTIAAFGSYNVAELIARGEAMESLIVTDRFLDLNDLSVAETFHSDPAKLAVQVKITAIFATSIGQTAD